MITVETIRERHSVREYDGKPLSRAEFDALIAVVGECARESGLDIQLVGDNPEVFNVIARFGLIRGCRTHVAFVVDDAKARGVAADEAIGYWGQKIVLAAQDMGLNTCWCALCSRKKSRAVVASGKKIRLIIAVGHGKTQGFSRKTKSVEALSSVECVKAPAWFAAAMEAAQLAPTAGLSRSLCKSFHRNLSILALMPSSHSSWLRTRAQPGWWHPSPHLEYSSFTRR